MRTIIYIGGFELPDKNAAAQRVLNNAKVFGALGYRVVLVGVSHNREYDRQLHPADSAGTGIEAWEVGYPATGRQWFDRIRAFWPLDQLAARGVVDRSAVEAVICYNHPAVAQMRISALARKWNAAALADCTEWYGSMPWTCPANIIKNLDIPLRMQQVNRRMDGLITTSPYITGFYAPTGLPTVEIPTLIEEPEGELPRLDFAKGPLPLFAMASGFSEGAKAEKIHDRIDWILELLDGAAQRGADFGLRIVGVDRDRYLSVFPDHRSLLERLGSKVEMLGRRPRTEVLRMLEASAFAFVLRHDTRVTLAGFPSKYSEAITYGTPVIINSLPSVRAYHIDGKTGFSLDLAEHDAAIAELCDILTMKPDEIMDLKRFCREYGAFDASAFVEPVGKFMKNVTG